MSSIISSNKSNEFAIDIKFGNNLVTERKNDGNLTLDELEKKFCKFLKDKMMDRNMPIQNLHKKISEIAQKYPSNKWTFYLLNKSQGIITNLEYSQVNMINLDGLSCYISAYLQGFIHIILPKAMKKYNAERESKGLEKVKNLDELKNNNKFNNAIIDTIIEVSYIQEFGHGGVDKNGNKTVIPKEVYNMEKELNLKNKKFLHQVLECEILINEAIYKFAKEAKEKLKDIDKLLSKALPNPPNSSIINKELIKIYEIIKSTIVSEVMKIKIDNKFYLNIVLNFDENTVNQQNLDIITLLDNCRQLKKDNFTKKKIQETSEIIYMIVDRISNGGAITKNIILYEYLYLDKNNSFFSKESSSNSILYELKFIIFHLYIGPDSGHYVAYSKFKGEWYFFNDLDNNYAQIGKPPLTFFKNLYPICFFYVKPEEKRKDFEKCNII